MHETHQTDPPRRFSLNSRTREFDTRHPVSARINEKRKRKGKKNRRRLRIIVARAAGSPGRGEGGQEGRLCLRKPLGCNRKATTGGELHLHLKLAQREIGIPPERTETQRGIVGIAQVVGPPSPSLDSLPLLHRAPSGIRPFSSGALCSIGLDVLPG